VPKATEEEAVNALREEIQTWCYTPFFVNAGTDDGGRHLQIWIERENPSERMDGLMCEMLPSGRYMDWRLIVIKCPPEYIRLHITHKKKKDW
tara:strand:+ start:1089 stop:1364 length:276 start_codon:yes stop_codon:yes gene_type:complete